MSDDEASAASDVLDVIDDSEVKSDDWSPVSIKQEQELDAVATDSSCALNVTSLVCCFISLFPYAYKKFTVLH